MTTWQDIGTEGRPVRIQRKRAKGWKMPPNTVSVCRPGPWGNPFIVGQDGTRSDCVRHFRILLGGYIALTTKATPDQQKSVLGYARENLKSLRGKNLACWCPPNAKCHADVLLELANAPSPPSKEGE